MSSNHLSKAWRWIGTGMVVWLCYAMISVEAEAQRISRDELERQFLYGWSTSSTLIFHGTVASVSYRDNPRDVGPQAEVLVRVDALQRGNPGSALVRVIIDDELQAYNWVGGAERIGEYGIWFLFRVRHFEGRSSTAYLIRYIDRQEMMDDPNFISELMRYVIQDSVDGMIEPNILNTLSLERDQSQRARVSARLQYDSNGRLSGIEFTEQSDSVLFNEHVADAIMELHRRIRILGGIRELEITVNRQVI